eukprot:gene5575-5547_t
MGMTQAPRAVRRRLAAGDGKGTSRAFGMAMLLVSVATWLGAMAPSLGMVGPAFAMIGTAIASCYAAAPVPTLAVGMAASWVGTLRSSSKAIERALYVLPARHVEPAGPEGGHGTDSAAVTVTGVPPHNPNNPKMKQQARLPADLMHRIAQ